jgi:hypothetical protein
VPGEHGGHRRADLVVESGADRPELGPTEVDADVHQSAGAIVEILQQKSGHLAATKVTLSSLRLTAQLVAHGWGQLASLVVYLAQLALGVGDHRQVEVQPTDRVVACGSHDLGDALSGFDQGYVERAAAEVH